jgi:signal transduction histidine kinase/CheY-like chemotaxis protein
MKETQFSRTWISEKIVRWMTGIACASYIGAVLTYCFILPSPPGERIGRLITTLIQVAVVLYIDFSSKMRVPLKACIIPLIAMVVELGFALVNGGDDLFFVLAIVWGIVSFSYIRPWGMGMFFVILNILLIPLLFFSNFNLVGPQTPRASVVAEFLVFEFAGLFLLLLSKLVHWRIVEIDKTGQTFETVLKVTPGHMVITNENAGVEYISDSLANWLGISQKQYAKNRPLLDLFRMGEEKMIFQEIMEQSGYVERSFELTRDGKKNWFLLRSSPLEENKFPRFFEWVDITPIMDAKNEAESAARAKTDFLANISHEIRTPMNAIIGMADLMLSGNLEPEQMTRADTVKGAALSLLNIINDILDFSKIDARKMEIIPQPFYVASLINDTVNMINLKTGVAGLAFTTAISKDIPPVLKSDELRIKQCLVNILNNAVKFTSRGYIHLRSWPEFLEDGSIKLHFSVSDTGRGIKKEDKGKLFSEFQQLDTHKDREIVGTGLGLAITRRLVELMGGIITVESTYGEGSTFSFFVICEKSSPESEEEGGFSADHKGKLAEVDHPENLRALCFEPRPYNARAIRDMLESLGVPCQVCVEIGRARALLKSETFTHVFFDTSGKEKFREFFARKGVSFVLLKEVPEKYDSIISNTLNRPILITALADILNGKRDYQKRRIKNDGENTGFFMTKDVRILAVDDNPVNLAVAQGLLTRYGVSVETASGGEESLEKIKHTEYDIVFMDHMMPGMDGLDATRAIRALGGRFAETIIIALTANAVSGVREQFLDAGMNDFLAKPVIIKDLQEILQRYLPPEKILGENGAPS